MNPARAKFELYNLAHGHIRLHTHHIWSPYRWLPGPRLYQSACRCECLARIWSFKQVPRFKVQLP